MIIYQTGEKWIVGEAPKFLFFVYDYTDTDTNGQYRLSRPELYFKDRLIKIYND
jgi:hypothetical protein